MVDSGTKPNIRLFTIGFTQKSAEQFFERLRAAGVKKLIDIRLNNLSQLAGFTKQGDLEYFLRTILGIEYVHVPELAPTQDILSDYRGKKIGFREFLERFSNLITERRIEDLFHPGDFDEGCLLCSEPTPEKCHRRIVSEYLRDKWGNVEIIHL